MDVVEKMSISQNGSIGILKNETCKNVTENDVVEVFINPLMPKDRNNWIKINFFMVSIAGRKWVNIDDST